MTRLRSTLVLAAALAVLAAAPAGAYQHLSSDTGGSGVSPDHWPALDLPIALTLDNGPTDISAEIADATATWNNVPTAFDPWGSATPAVDGSNNPVDFTGANFGTAWGNLTGDGKQEVIFDETGTALTALGLAPASINGFGPSHTVVSGGQSVIDDMYLIVNGTRTDFDRRSTETHELGHTLGLAHSSVGFSIDKNGALSPELESQVPTMHPFAIAGTDRRTLEADDVASLSELYPELTFASTTGTITGTVTRCGSGEPVLGANVRAINVASPAIQLTRVTGFDGKTDGSYTIHGVPPGDYDVVVEPLAGDTQYLASLAMFTRVDTDFTQEFLNASKEDDCAQDTDPTDRESIQVGASGTKTADLKVEGATLALVVDVTGSMGPEIGAIKTGLEDMITALEVVPGSFPKTAIVTFDDAATIRTVSRDPDRLRSVIAGLTTHGTPDCPEGSNAAAMTAGRLLGSGGRAILVTDADSHPTGPSRADVDALYTSKGARLSVLLSGSCPPPPPHRAARAAAFETLGAPGAGPDQAKPVDVLGFENSVRTFSEESLFSGGLFSFQPEIKSGTADATERYSDTLANVAISAVIPAVAALSPSALPQGTTLDLELTGSNTGFRPGSTVAVAGSGVSVASTQVLSPTRIVVRLAVAADAAMGFRDVTVRTDRGDSSIENAKGIGAVQVVAPPSAPTVLSVTPSTVAVGSTRDVTISGGLTHFDGSSVAGFGAGVTVNSVTADSPTTAVANVTVAPGAAIGFRDVTVQTGAELANETVPGPFLVTAAPPAIARLTSASPSSGARGSTLDVVLTGADTAFEAGTSLASVSGTGVQVLSTTVSSPTSAVARLKIAGAAPLGFRDLKVTTGAQDAALLNGFEVKPAAPVVSKPTPTPTPTAGASGAPPPAGGPPGTGPPSTCSDRSRPSASFLKGKQGVRAKHGRLRLRGRASDKGCAAAVSVEGGVARVEVAISRAASRHRCRFVARSGKLTSARSCSKPVLLKAKGTTKWSLSTKRRLPRGTYTIQLRARDVAGNRQAKAAKRIQRVA
jgi:Quinohemoprotein amine dehydrogenase, alpha subunit domain III